MARKPGAAKAPQALTTELNRLAEALQDPLPRAQSRAFDAMEATAASRRLALAREALEISPLAADAWGLFASAAPPGSDLALLLWRQAAAAGTLAIGPLALSLDPGDYWGVLETRPAMRARCGFALELWRHGQREAAIAEAQDMLRLNPGDNQGMRYALMDWLLAAGRDRDAAALREAYAEDGAATWAYASALLLFRAEGPSAAADRALGDALAANPHLAAQMLERAPAPREAAAYAPGSPEEAAWAAPSALPAWAATAGALDWLGRHAPPPPAPRQRAKGRSGGGAAIG